MLDPQELRREWLGSRLRVGLLDRGACCGDKTQRDDVGSAVNLERHGSPQVGAAAKADSETRSHQLEPNSTKQDTGHRSRVTGHRSQVTGHKSQVTGHGSHVTKETR